jgi:glutaminyl-tRNA synthetase
MYDFAHPISDFIENITHSLCTLEFQDNRRLYDWVLDKISNGKNSPHQYEFSRLNLEYTILSKRILSELVENKIVAGWNDPRMPTIAGMSNRGYTPESIKKFIRGIGVSKTDSIIPMTLLEDNVREELNQYSPRTMAVLDPIEIVITNYEDSKKEILKAPLHPQNEEMGSREITFSNSIYIEKEDFRMEANKKYKRLVLNKEVRLRNSYVIKAESVETDENGEVVKIYCTYDKDTLGKNPEDRKVKGVIHWVNAKTAIKAKINLYDRLFSVANVAKSIKEKNILESINPNSLVVKTAFVEENMLENKSKLAYQFERIGYFYRNPNSENELEFNRTVSLRDTWSD